MYSRFAFRSFLSCKRWWCTGTRLFELILVFSLADIDTLSFAKIIGGTDDDEDDVHDDDDDDDFDRMEVDGNGGGGDGDDTVIGTVISPFVIALLILPMFVKLV